MSDETLKELKKRLDCLILLTYLKEAPEKERLKLVVNCLGLRETARLLGKDSGNLSRSVNEKKKKEVKNGTETI